MLNRVWFCVCVTGIIWTSVIYTVPLDVIVIGSSVVVSVWTSVRKIVLFEVTCKREVSIHVFLLASFAHLLSIR